MLKRSAGYQTSQCLVFFTLSICLPPVRILLRNYVEYITFLKAYAQLSARYVWVFLGIVIEMRSYMYLDANKNKSFMVTNVMLYLCCVRAIKPEQLFPISVDLKIISVRVTYKYQCRVVKIREQMSYAYMYIRFYTYVGSVKVDALNKL